jgi:hypothetical protein
VRCSVAGKVVGTIPHTTGEYFESLSVDDDADAVIGASSNWALLVPFTGSMLTPATFLGMRLRKCLWMPCIPSATAPRTRTLR